MRMLSAIAIFVASFTGAAAAQAGWVGGGGAFIEDNDNPWFIQNTRQATYCVWADEQSFGLSQERLRQISAEALRFWKTQVSKINYIDYVDRANHRARVEVATQDFTEIPCDRNPDITFQFGVLTETQRDHLLDPAGYAGITVRTDYDKTNLRGRGFIYLSPQSGPLKLKHAKLDQPWSYHDGILAQIILTHELGHVFGFQHDEQHWLTSAGIANILEYSSLAVYGLELQFNRLNTAKDFFFASDNAMGYGFAGRTDFLRKLWGIGSQDTNVTVRVEDNRFLVYAYDSSRRDGPGNLVGSASLRKKEFGPNRRIGYFWVPKEQHVFPGFDMDTSFPFGSTHATTRYEGAYRSIDGSVLRQVKITTHSPYSIDIGGELDGKAYIDFWQGI